MLDWIHARMVFPRRVRVLARHLAELLPEGADVLDVGCGDGRIAAALLAARPDLRVEGVDVLVRPRTAIPVVRFDGATLPFAEGSFDVVLFVDMLHHARAPERLLAEAVRVARRGILVKDHLRRGLLAGPTLAFMDRVGNLRHGVAMTYDYWTPGRWRTVFGKLGLRGGWRTRLGLYPWPLRLLFERSLHFLVLLELPPSPEEPGT